MKKLTDNILIQVSTFFKVSDIEEMLMVWCRTQRPVSFFSNIILPIEAKKEKKHPRTFLRMVTF